MSRTLHARSLLTTLLMALAVTAAMLPTSASAAELNLAAFRNNVGICQHPLHQCNFDGGGFSYSAAALSLAGVRGGTQIAVDGMTYTWPNVSAGQPDNVEMNGQKVPVLPGNATRIGFLGAGHNAPVTAHLRLHYTDIDSDGELVEVVVVKPLTFSDWTLNAGSAQPVAGTKTVISTAFRVNGTTVDRVPTYVFAAAIDIDPTMHLQTIEFPAEGKVHLFGMALA